MNTLVTLVSLWTFAFVPGESPAPTSIVVSTTSGVTRIPVSMERGQPTIPIPLLARALPVSSEIQSDWVVIQFAREPFRFLLGAPVLMHRRKLVPLVSSAYVLRDTVFVPLQWLTDYVPRFFREAYRYDPYAARFEETRLSPILAQDRLRMAKPGSRAARRGFKLQHKVVIDAGHGGTDPGNPGLRLPKNVQEKDVTLAIAQALRVELQTRGVEVVMTRVRDTLISIYDRAPMCSEDCALFASIHVNSMPSGRRNEAVNGIETYFLGASRTAEANRVAEMENDALRYETGRALVDDDPLTFILKDLHANEYLRESANLANLVQHRAAKVHPGADRGVSQHNGFIVLLAARRPAILLEAGFATNRRDARFLASESGQRALAQAIADGIEEYLLQYERKVMVGVGP